jgi:hypothetical protein
VIPLRFADGKSHRAGSGAPDFQGRQGILTLNATVPLNVPAYFAGKPGIVDADVSPPRRHDPSTLAAGITPGVTWSAHESGLLPAGQWIHQASGMPGVDFGKEFLVDARSRKRAEFGEQSHTVWWTDDVDEPGWRWTGVSIGVGCAAGDEGVVTSGYHHDIVADAYFVLSLKHQKRLLVSGVDVISDARFANRVSSLDEGVAAVVTLLVEDLQPRPPRRAQRSASSRAMPDHGRFACHLEVHRPRVTLVSHGV